MCFSFFKKEMKKREDKMQRKEKRKTHTSTYFWIFRFIKIITKFKLYFESFFEQRYVYIFFFFSHSKKAVLAYPAFSQLLFLSLFYLSLFLAYIPCLYSFLPFSSYLHLFYILVCSIFFFNNIAS